MIAQSQLSKLSNRLLKEQGGRRIPESVLEKDYCIAWFLVGLARAPLREKLIFKGGTALKRCHIADYRFSEDLDFTLLQEMSLEELEIELMPVYQEVKRASNISFTFCRPDSKSHLNSHTFYLNYEGPLPLAAVAKELKVDVTRKEKVVHPPNQLSILKSYAEYSDLPAGDTILVYSLEEIASEKTIAILDRARTEPRDLYDLWQLTEVLKNVDLLNCIPAIEEKLSHRGKTLTDVQDEFHKKEPRLKATWQTRLGSQIANLDEFDGVFRAVRRNLRQAEIIK